VQNWPGNISNNQFVPSAYACSERETAGVWGYVAEPRPTAIRQAKLELGTVTRSDSLDVLFALLKNVADLKADKEMPVPQYLSKQSSEVIADFLREVSAFVRDVIITEHGSDILDRSPIDFVFTHPAVRNLPRERIEAEI
jgi:hypothetical protein